MSTYVATFEPRSEAITHGVVAGLSFAGAIWVAWMVGAPWHVDINHPDFNPMIILVGLLAAVAAWHGVKATIWMRRARRLGGTTLTLDVPVPVRLGTALTGRMTLAMDPRATGEGTLTLVCQDIHSFRKVNRPVGREKLHAFTIWSADQRISKGLFATRVVKFRFDLPGSVGDKLVTVPEQKNPYFEFKAAVTVPFFRRVWTHNAPPLARRWTLTLTVPGAESSLNVGFDVPIEL